MLFLTEGKRFSERRGTKVQKLARGKKDTLRFICRFSFFLLKIADSCMKMKENWWGGCFLCVIHEENNHVILPDTRMMYMCTIQILRFLFVLRKKVNYFLW